VNKTLSRVFQSVRLVVNDELTQLLRGLVAAVDLLCSQARLVVISYHSLEDRIVKDFIRDHTVSKSADCAESVPKAVPELRMVTKKPIRAADDEIKANPRARSAGMRVAEKI
jgi:16S rRNA (cytosine1402-N4)-methyltransferase